MSQDVNGLVREVARLCPKTLEKKHLTVERFRALKKLLSKHKLHEERMLVHPLQVRKRGEKTEIERSRGIWVEGEVLGVAGEGRLEVRFKDLYKVTYRGMCRLARAYLLKEHSCLLETKEFREETCHGGICCQARTGEGKRCKRRASDWTSWDLARRFRTGDILAAYGKLSTEAKAKAGLTHLSRDMARRIYRKVACVQCCFFCWQHAAIEGIGRGLGIFALATSSELYYLTHLDELLSIFFSKVVPVKKGTITVAIQSVGPPNPPGTMVHKALEVIQSWWGFFADVMFYMIMLIIVKASPPLLKAMDQIFGKGAEKMMDLMKALALRLLAYTSMTSFKPKTIETKPIKTKTIK